MHTHSNNTTINYNSNDTYCSKLCNNQEYTCTCTSGTGGLLGGAIGAYGRFPKFHCVFLGRDPGTLKSDIVSKKHPQLICSDLRLSYWKFEDWNYGNRPYWEVLKGPGSGTKGPFGKCGSTVFLSSNYDPKKSRQGWGPGIQDNTFFKLTLYHGPLISCRV